MGIYSKTEVEDAFWNFHDALNESGKTADWSIVGERMTPDAMIYESVLGKIGKREGIVREVSRTMHISDPETPWVHLNRFPVEAYSIDHRDWVWSIWYARFSDPGDGSIHQARVFMLMKYHGKGEFHYVETVYNPVAVNKAMESWKAKKAEWDNVGAGELDMLAARQDAGQEMAPLKLD